MRIPQYSQILNNVKQYLGLTSRIEQLDTTVICSADKHRLVHENYDFDRMSLFQFAMLFKPHYMKSDESEKSIDNDA